MWEALATLGTGLFTGLTNWNSQKHTNEMNKQLAREQMAFQERMSNTQVQRYADDLQAAGFNRLLAANGGQASSPSGQSAHVSAPQVTPLDIMAIGKARADISKTKAETAVSLATEKNLLEQNKNLAAQNVVLRRQAAKYLVDMGMTKVQAQKTMAETNNINYELGGKTRSGSYDSDNMLMRSMKGLLRDFRDGDPIYRDDYSNQMSRLPAELQW